MISLAALLVLIAPSSNKDIHLLMKIPLIVVNVVDLFIEQLLDVVPAALIIPPLIALPFQGKRVEIAYGAVA
jgi:hypothetical protein